MALFPLHSSHSHTRGNSCCSNLATDSCTCYSWCGSCDRDISQEEENSQDIRHIRVSIRMLFACNVVFDFLHE